MFDFVSYSKIKKYIYIFFKMAEEKPKEEEKPPKEGEEVSGTY